MKSIFVELQQIFRPELSAVCETCVNTLWNICKLLQTYETR